MDLSHFVNIMNRWGQEKVPFLFMVDFEMVSPLIIRLDEARQNGILYFINGISNAEEKRVERSMAIEKKPGRLSDYEKKFNKVLHHLEYGDTFLTNLTISTEIDLANSLQDIFFQSDAKYKLLFKDQFLVFSPETFAQIRNGKIYASPKATFQIRFWRV